MRRAYDKLRSELSGLDGIAIAVVVQAIDDWRFLCRHGKETHERNFAELKYFFENDCDTYLAGTRINAHEIWQHLRREKVYSIYNT